VVVVKCRRGKGRDAELVVCTAENWQAMHGDAQNQLSSEPLSQ
jgi:hypothetical protein